MSVAVSKTTRKNKRPDTGRCYGLEIAPALVDLAVTRWQNFTGQQATLETDGRTFAKIARKS